MTGPGAFPRPTPFVISQAVSSGLNIPAIQIDPRFNFVQGAFIFASDIDKMEMKFRTWRVPLAEARDAVVIPSIEKNFSEEGRPKWKPLAKTTIMNRMYLGFSRGPILERTSRLRKTATQRNLWELVSAVGRDGVDMLRLRTTYLDQKVPYAPFMQLGSNPPTQRVSRSLRGRITRSGGFGPGSTGGSFYERFKGMIGSGFGLYSTNILYPSTGGKIPARPFIQLTGDEEVEIYGIFFNFMSDQVDKYWGPETKGRGL